MFLVALICSREVANAGLAQGPIDEAGMETKAQQSASDSSLPQDCLTTGKVYRPLMDEKHFDLFSKAAEVLPQWVEKLSREEYLKLVPGGDDSCLGGKQYQRSINVVVLNLALCPSYSPTASVAKGN